MKQVPDGLYLMRFVDDLQNFYVTCADSNPTNNEIVSGVIHNMLYDGMALSPLGCNLLFIYNPYTILMLL